MNDKLRRAYYMALYEFIEPLAKIFKEFMQAKYCISDDNITESIHIFESARMATEDIEFGRCDENLVCWKDTLKISVFDNSIGSGAPALFMRFIRPGHGDMIIMDINYSAIEPGIPYVTWYGNKGYDDITVNEFYMLTNKISSALHIPIRVARVDADSIYCDLCNLLKNYMPIQELIRDGNPLVVYGDSNDASFVIDNKELLRFFIKKEQRTIHIHIRGIEFVKINLEDRQLFFYQRDADLMNLTGNDYVKLIVNGAVLESLMHDIADKYNLNWTYVPCKIKSISELFGIGCNSDSTEQGQETATAIHTEHSKIHIAIKKYLTGYIRKHEEYGTLFTVFTSDPLGFIYNYMKLDGTSGTFFRAIYYKNGIVIYPEDESNNMICAINGKDKNVIILKKSEFTDNLALEIAKYCDYTIQGLSPWTYSNYKLKLVHERPRFNKHNLIHSFRDKWPTEPCTFLIDSMTCFENKLFGDDMRWPDNNKKEENKVKEEVAEKKENTENEEVAEKEEKKVDNLIIDNCLINEDKRTVTIVWSDGVKTISRAMKEDTFDPEVGFAMCYMKKIFTSRENFKKKVQEYVDLCNRKKEAKEKAAAKKKAKQKPTRQKTRSTKKKAEPTKNLPKVKGKGKKETCHE